MRSGNQHIYILRSSVLLFNRLVLDKLAEEMISFDVTFEGNAEKMR